MTATRKPFIIANVILSLVLLVTFVIFTVNDFLSVGNSYVWLLCYSGPFVFALLLGVWSFTFIVQYSSWLKYLPLCINILTAVAAFVLFNFIQLNPDFGFLRLYEDYEAAATLIEKGDLQADRNGFVKLPADLEHTSLTGYVFVSEEAGVTTVYFLYDSETFDGYSWGYLYRSDGSEPPEDHERDWGNCYRWRSVQPLTPKWLYCKAHPKYMFPGW